MSRPHANSPYALVLENLRLLAVHRPVERQVAGEGQALVESMFVGLCGTDLEVIDGVSDRARPPVVLGHEWAGRVVAAGAGVDRGLVSAFVVGDNVVPCHECDPCIRGDTHVCLQTREIGFELPGAFASHFVIPAANLRPLPERLHRPFACLIEPLAVSVHAVRAAALLATDSVLVLGDGVIGLFVACIASLSGTRNVTLVGKHDDRLGIACALGIQRVCLQRDFQSNSATHRTDWPVVFEASGTAMGIATALDAAGTSARVILAGDYGPGPVPTAPTTVVRKELQLIGSNASSGAWDEAVRLVSTAAVDLSAVTQLVLPFDQWPDAIQAARERRAPRVVLRHPAADTMN